MESTIFDFTKPIMKKSDVLKKSESRDSQKDEE